MSILLWYLVLVFLISPGIFMVRYDTIWHNISYTFLVQVALLLHHLPFSFTWNCIFKFAFRIFENESCQNGSIHYSLCDLSCSIQSRFIYFNRIIYSLIGPNVWFCYFQHSVHLRAVVDEPVKHAHTYKPYSSTRSCFLKCCTLCTELCTPMNFFSPLSFWG